MAAILAEIFGWAGQFIAMILGVLIMVVTWFIQFALNLNDSVTTMPTVTRGMDITLSLTNLGFITILIVIAISTILRRENYGAKKLLSKLIIAALLVNFSLPIAGGILHIADSFTVFFINNSVPHFTPGGTSISDFGTAIGKAFAPQAIGTVIFTPSTSTASNAVNSLAGVGNSLLISLTIPFFAVFYALAILIVLIALFVMLIIRFVYLIILLILMPLAWICWITPLTQDLWQKWWKDFLHWTLFAPIMMMFLYITFQTMNQMATMAAPSDAAAKAAMGNPNIISVLGQEIALLAVTIGGLIAANSMGIKGAGAALNTAKGTAKWGANKLSRAGAGKALNSGVGKSLTGAMQRMPLLRGVGNALDRASQTYGGKARTDEEEKKAQGMSEQGRLNNFNAIMAKGGPRNASEAGIIQAMHKNGELKEDQKNAITSLGKNKFSQIGAEGLFNKIDSQSVIDEKMHGLIKTRDAAETANNTAKASGNPAAMTSAQASLDAANKAIGDHFENKLANTSSESRKDLISSMKAYMNPNDTHGLSTGSHSTVQAQILSNLVENDKKTYNTVISAVKGSDRGMVMQGLLDNILDKVKASTPSAADKTQIDGLKGKAYSTKDPVILQQTLQKIVDKGGVGEETAVKNLLGDLVTNKEIYSTFKDSSGKGALLSYKNRGGVGNVSMTTK